MAKPAPLEQLLAMIGDKHDQRVVEHAHLVELRPQTTKLHIPVLELGIVELGQVVAERIPPLLILDIPPFKDGPHVTANIAVERDIVSRIHILGRRAIRVVRIDVVDVEIKRIGLVQRLLGRRQPVVGGAPSGQPNPRLGSRRNLRRG